MRKGITVCERWVSTCSETLTSQYWKRFLPHPWRGEKFVPENLSQLAARLEEVTYMYMYSHVTDFDLLSSNLGLPENSCAVLVIPNLLNCI